MNRWYVANTRAKDEHRAALNLRRQGFVVYLRCYSKRRSHARRIDYVRAALFPKYVFINLNLDDSHWACINSTRGIHHLITVGNRPSQVPFGIVEEIKSREGEGGLVSLNRQFNIKKGDRVTVTSGAFCDQSGIFERQDDENRIVILLQLLGREIKVSLPPAAISV